MGREEPDSMNSQVKIEDLEAAQGDIQYLDEAIEGSIHSPQLPVIKETSDPDADRSSIKKTSPAMFSSRSCTSGSMQIKSGKTESNAESKG